MRLDDGFPWHPPGTPEDLADWQIDREMAAAVELDDPPPLSSVGYFVIFSLVAALGFCAGMGMVLLGVLIREVVRCPRP